MYKKRITKWGLKKNYKSHEKVEFIEQMEAAEKDSEQPIPLEIHDQPVKLHRIKRHIKYMKKSAAEVQMKETGEILDAVEQETEPQNATVNENTPRVAARVSIPFSAASNTISSSNKITQTRKPPRTSNFPPFWRRPDPRFSTKILSYMNKNFSQFPSTKREENLLFTLKEGLQSGLFLFSSAHSSSSGEMDTCYSTMLGNIAKLHSDVLSAIHSFKSRANSDARVALNSACEMLTLMVRRKEWPLMFKLCEMFTWSDWGSLVAVRECLFKFAYQFSRELHGEDSPFTRVFQCMADQQVLNNILESAMKLVIEHVNRESSMVSTETVYDLQLHAISAFKRRFDYTTSASLAHSLILYGEQHYGYYSDQSCIALTRLARVYCKKGELKLAKEIYEEALCRRVDFQGKTPLKWTDYYPCRDLGLVNAALGLHEESERCWRLSLQLIWDIACGNQDSTQDFDLEKSYCTRMLEIALQKQEKLEEARELVQRFGPYSSLALTLVEEDQDIWVWAAKMNDRFCLAALLKNGKIPLQKIGVNLAEEQTEQETTEDELNPGRVTVQLDAQSVNISHPFLDTARPTTC